MPEAVIVATARSPIGRANKGSLVDMRPDELAAQIVTALLAKVPELPSGEIEDLIMGCGQPAGEAGFNIARVVAILAGLNDVPGVTVNRYCSSSLQTIRMAAHAIRAGEGDVFIAAGVECVSRYGHGASDSAPNPHFQATHERTALRAQGGQPPWTAPEGMPDIYIAMGQTAENVRELENVSRMDMDEFAALSQNRAVANQENGFFEREITPVTLPDGTIVSRDDGPRPGTTVEKLAELKPSFRPDGEVTAGNSCPLNDGAAAVVVMSDTRAARARYQAARSCRGVFGHRAQPRDHGPRTDRGVPQRHEARRHEDRRHRPRRDQRGVRRADRALGAPPRHSVRQAERAWRRHRARASVRHDRRPHHDHPAQRPGRPGKSIGMESMCVGGGQGMAMIVERLA